VPVVLFLLLVAFSRFWNISNTATFTEDESKDLVGIHGIYVDKNLTLVGPRNSQGTKVFSSSTFYMLLPGAILTSFDPVGPAYSSAFWGVITALIILLIARKINPKLSFWVSILVLVWYPLLLTSRWAWNPNLIPFWTALAVYFFLKKGWWKLLAGVSLGLTVHSHYYSIFAAGMFVFVYLVDSLRKRKLKEWLYLISGLLFALLPFVVFDLLHPPGIFVTGIFSQARSVSGALDFQRVIINFFTSIKEILFTYTRSEILGAFLGISLTLLLVADLKAKSYSIVYFLPWLVQIILVSFLPEQFGHYLIPGLIFFLIWVVYQRKQQWGKKVQLFTVAVLIIGGLFSLKSQLTLSTSYPPIPIMRTIAKDIFEDITQNDRKNVNMAVLASPDKNTEGKRYRDLLLVMGNLNILTRDQYSLSDHLFVISTSGEKTVREDPALEMNDFRAGPLVESIEVANSPWLIYHFTRSKRL